MAHPVDTPSTANRCIFICPFLFLLLLLYKYFAAGDESLAAELRLRVAVEMMHCKEIYLAYPLAASFNTLSSTFDDAVRSCVKVEGCSSYSSMWTMLALTAVVRRRISSHHPYLNGPDDEYADLANTIMDPITLDFCPAGEAMNLMWTRTGRHIGDVWVSNHVVALFESAHSAG